MRTARGSNDIDLKSFGEACMDDGINDSLVVSLPADSIGRLDNQSLIAGYEQLVVSTGDGMVAEGRGVGGPGVGFAVDGLENLGTALEVGVVVAVGGNELAEAILNIGSSSAVQALSGLPGGTVVGAGNKKLKKRNRLAKNGLVFVAVS
jgi:hypothetical protein